MTTFDYVRCVAILPLLCLLNGTLEAQAKAHITLTGGPQAGTYDMVGSPACDAFDTPSEDRGFAAEFVADPPHGWRHGPPYLSHLWLTTPRMRNPKPDAVAFGVTFTKWGTPETETDYKVYTISPRAEQQPGVRWKADRQGPGGGTSRGREAERHLQRRNGGRGTNGRHCGVPVTGVALAR